MVRSLFLSVVSIFLLGVRAAAQVATTVSIGGLVSDTSGAWIAGADIKAANQATGAAYTTKTNGAGSYMFPVVQPGTYRITAAHPGFRTVVVSDRVLEVGIPAHIDIVMPIGSVTEQLTVSAEGDELLTVGTAEISTTITPKLVQNLPLVRRNFLDLAVVTAGAVPQDTSLGAQISNGSAQLNFVQAGNVFTQSNVFIGGARDTSTNVALDGSNIQNSLFGEVLQFQSPATIQEMKVERANMSAEFGNGVAAINLISKSGSNQWHGDAYEFLRNNKLDATPFFTNLAGRKNPNFQQNQFGASVGGPLKKDKLMVFGNYEGLRTRQSEVATIMPVPDSLRNGDFSQYRPSIPGQPGQFGPRPTIYNPYRYNAATGLREPFPGNVIPQGPTTLCAPKPTCIDPSVAAYLSEVRSRAECDHRRGTALCRCPRVGD